MISSNSQKLGLQERITASNCMLKAQDSIVINNYCFFIRIVSKWNNLPRDRIEAESLHHLKISFIIIYLINFKLELCFI